MKELFGIEEKKERKMSRKVWEEKELPRRKKSKPSKEIIEEEIPDAELLKLKKHFEK
jgi:hypothetical protein